MSATNNFSSALERAKAIAAKLAASKGVALPTSEPQELQPAPPQQVIQMSKKKSEDNDGQLKRYVPVIKTIEIVIPSHMVPLVLGRGGETLKSIEMACNVSVDLEEKGDEKSARIAYVKGEEMCVDEAKIRIDDIVHGAGSLSVLMGGTHRVGDQTIYVQVPATRVGLVIGKGGETIKSLQDRTGARINVTKDDEGGPNRTIVVAGSQHQLALAQREIDDIVNGTSFAGGFGVGGASESIKVQKDKVGLIIGKGGEAIKQIQGDCNVKLNVEAFADENGERTVTIAGTTECIAMAKEMIWEKIDGRRGISESTLGEQYNAGHAQQDPAYAAAYGSGAVKKNQFDPVTYAPYYKQYYENMGYTFPAGFDIVAYLRQQQDSL